MFNKAHLYVAYLCSDYSWLDTRQLVVGSQMIKLIVSTYFQCLIQKNRKHFTELILFIYMNITLS